MKVSVFLQTIKKFFLFLFVFFCLIFPAADLIISKKILFVLNLALLSIEILINYDKKITEYTTFVRILIILTIIITFSIPTFPKYSDVVIYLIVTCITLLITISAHELKDFFLRAFLISANILSMLTVFIALLSLYSKVLVIAANTIFVSLDSGSIGVRKFGPIEMTMVHFRTAPVLIISVSYYFKKLFTRFTLIDFLLLTLNVSAIVFSASRGTILFSLLSIFCMSFCKISIRKYRIVFVLFCFVGLFGGVYIITNTNMLSKNEKSNSIKLGHIDSFNEYIDNEPEILIKGKGTGSYYYSKGFRKDTWQTETTYLDMLRYFGLIFTTILLLAIGMPSKKSIMNVPFVFYFIDAATNPLIFCSTGMLVISLYLINQEKR